MNWQEICILFFVLETFDVHCIVFIYENTNYIVFAYISSLVIDMESLTNEWSLFLTPACFCWRSWVLILQTLACLYQYRTWRQRQDTSMWVLSLLVVQFVLKPFNNIKKLMHVEKWVFIKDTNIMVHIIHWLPLLQLSGFFSTNEFGSHDYIMGTFWQWWFATLHPTIMTF